MKSEVCFNYGGRFAVLMGVFVCLALNGVENTPTLSVAHQAVAASRWGRPGWTW